MLILSLKFAETKLNLQQLLKWLSMCLLISDMVYAQPLMENNKKTEDQLEKIDLQNYENPTNNDFFSLIELPVNSNEDNEFNYIINKLLNSKNEQLDEENKETVNIFLKSNSLIP